MMLPLDIKFENVSLVPEDKPLYVIGEDHEMKCPACGSMGMMMAVFDPNASNEERVTWNCGDCGHSEEVHPKDAKRVEETYALWRI